MTSRILLLALLLLPVARAHADAPREEALLVVGVYRPVELSGRTVRVPREVYLQRADGSADGLGALVGRTLPVYRQVTVPAAVALPVAAPPPVPAAEPAPVAADPPPAAPPAAPVRRTTAAQRRQAAREGRAEPEPPPEAAAPPPTEPPPPPPAPPVLAPPPPVSETIVRVAPRPLPAATYEVEVGRIEVVAVRGAVAVARVVGDGLGPEAAGAPGASDLPVVLSGDVARVEVAPAAPPGPPGLSDAERRAVEAERRAVGGEKRRRSRPRRPMERKEIKWKL